MPPSSSAAPRSAPNALRRRRTTVVAALLAPLLAAAVPVLATPAQAAPKSVVRASTIEALAPYQGQTLCDPVARPGAVALRQLVLAAYPGTADGGIIRACSTGGASEHKEGRAWDWRVSATNPTHAAQVADLMNWLLAPDEHGNTAAMARRLGIMYVIWDAKVWKSYQAAKGWQPYTGASPHTDHVHFSLSWAGAYAKTSYWTGSVAPVMQGPAPKPAPPSATPGPTTGPVPSPTTGPVATAPVAAKPTRAPVPAGPPIVDRAKQRRVVVDRAPGPWRRH